MSQMGTPLEGSLVRLRAAEEATVTALVPALGDTELIPLALAAIFPPTVESKLAFWRGQVEGGTVYLIIERIEDARPLGVAMLRAINRRNRNAELGMWLARPHWGQGFGTDALRTLCRFAFEEMGLYSIYLSSRADNPRALAAYEKVGFRHDGLFREHTFAEGAYRDMVVMGITAQEVRSG